MDLKEILDFTAETKSLDERLEIIEIVRYFDELFGQEYVHNLEQIDFIRGEELMNRLKADFKDVFGCEFKDRLPLEKLKKLYPDLKK